MSLPNLAPYCSCGAQATGLPSTPTCPNTNTGIHNFTRIMMTNLTITVAPASPTTPTTLKRFTDRVKKRDENGCHICGFTVKLQARHIVDLQYTDEFIDYVFNHYNENLPDSPNSTENGWLICPNCNISYNDGDLTILSDGTIVCSDKLKLSEPYKSLHGTTVVWANRINKPHYPTNELFDYVNKKTNKCNLAEQFNSAAKSSGSKRKTTTKTTNKSASTTGKRAKSLR